MEKQVVMQAEGQERLVKLTFDGEFYRLTITKTTNNFECYYESFVPQMEAAARDSFQRFVDKYCG